MTLQSVSVSSSIQVDTCELSPLPTTVMAVDFTTVHIHVLSMFLEFWNYYFLVGKLDIAKGAVELRVVIAICFSNKRRKRKRGEKKIGQERRRPVFFYPRKFFLFVSLIPFSKPFCRSPKSSPQSHPVIWHLDKNRYRIQPLYDCGYYKLQKSNE